MAPTPFRTQSTLNQTSADIVLLVSPHFGLVDSWLPVISALKQRRPDTSICAIIPETEVSRVDSKDFMAREARKYIDYIVFAGTEMRWTAVKRFEDIPSVRSSRRARWRARALRQVGQVLDKFKRKRENPLPTGCKV